jgi:hypothetical protein
VAQEKFGNLGRLIEEDKYYKPEYTPMVAPAGVILDADELKLLKSAVIKEFVESGKDGGGSSEAIWTDPSPYVG